VQALRCVQVMSLLMRQYLRDKVEASLLHYQEFWQAYAIPQGSRVAYAGVFSRLWEARDQPRLVGGCYLYAAPTPAVAAYCCIHAVKEKDTYNAACNALGGTLFCQDYPPQKINIVQCWIAAWQVFLITSPLTIQTSP
jgi:hypothetical protein